MDHPPKKSPWPRRLLRVAIAGAIVSLGLFAWGVLFPVPLGWPARFALSRALPTDSPLQPNLESVTFRWRWGQPALAVELHRLTAAAQGRPLLEVADVTVEVRKAELWQRRFVPAHIRISAPRLTFDQTPAGALALLLPTSVPVPTTSTLAAPATSAASATPAPASSNPASDLAALAALLPPPGETAKLTIAGFNVRLKNSAGETVLPFGLVETTVAQTKEGSVQLDLALPLTGGNAPPVLTLHSVLETRSGRATFSVKLPAFASADLPVLPGAPPLPLRATVAADFTGHFDIATSQVQDLAGGFTVSNGDVSLPGSGTSLPIEKIEVRGRYDLRDQHAVLESARAKIGSLEINLDEFDATLAPELRARWKISLAGPKGSEVFPLLPAALRAKLPVSPEAFAAVAVDRFNSEGRVHLARNSTGAWISRSLETQGELRLALGREPFALNWKASHPAYTDAISAEVNATGLVPAAWPAVLTTGTPLAALDLPFSISARATLSPDFQPRSARVALTAASGQVKPLQPGLPPLAVRRVEVQVESEQFDRAWRVPLARLELDGGATAELLRAQAELTAGRAHAEGELRAENLSGAFAALFLPAGTWTPLTAASLAAEDLSLTELNLRFAGTATSDAASWQLSTLSAAGDIQLRANSVPLTLSTRLALPDGGKEIEASVDLAEFRPSQLRLTLPGGLSTDALDFPISLKAVARTSVTGDLNSANAQLRIRSGRLKTPAAFGDLDLPVDRLALDATFDPKLQRAEIKTAHLSAGGVQLTLNDLTTHLAPPHVVTGRAELAPFSLATALALWPASQQPDTRRKIQSTIQTAEFAGANFEWNVAINPAASPAVTLSQVRGTARLRNLAASPAEVPGPVSVGNVTLALDYPRASVELLEVSAPGARLSSVRANVEALNSARPSAAVTASFAIDLAAANRAWRFASPGVLDGISRGELSVQAPFTAESIDGQVTLDLSQTKLPLPGFPNAAPAELKLTFRAEQLLTAKVPAIVDVSIATSNWLGAPLRLSSRTELTANARQPTLIELKTYEHGLTRLQGKFHQPDARHQEISLTGSTLDLVPLLRFGLAVADGFAVTPPPAAPAATLGSTTIVTPTPTLATPPLAPPAPAVNLDVQIDQVVFGPGETAQNFQLSTRLENNWPTKLTLQALAKDSNSLSAELSGPAERQKLNLTIGAAADWMRTLTAPWAAAPPAAGQFGSLITQLMKVPSIVSGGGIVAAAEIRRHEKEWLQGSFKLSRATLVRAPRVLQLLALKTGKSLQKTPLIEDFSIGKLTLNPDEVKITGVALAGSGLIDRFKITSANYGLGDDRLYIDGEYFGVGFEIKGTRAKPEFWGKDSNLLIRSIGTRKENFGFDEDTEPAPKSPAPKR